MTQPAAKLGDQVLGVDTHVLMVPSPGGPVPTPTPMPFSGALSDALSDDVLFMNQKAAVDGSKAPNLPPHIPVAGPFQSPPKNEGTVQAASTKVQINNKPVARHGDSVMTCNDPADAPNATVVAVGTVLVG